MSTCRSVQAFFGFQLRLLVCYSIASDMSVQDRHVDMSICSSISHFVFLIRQLFFLVFRFCFIYLIFFSVSFQQHTGERKQMAKAIAAVNKSAKAPSFKKRPISASVATPPPKRRSYQPDRVVTCYNCQQTGHIAPRCPSRTPSASTPAPKAPPKK